MPNTANFPDFNLKDKARGEKIPSFDQIIPHGHFPFNRVGRYVCVCSVKSNSIMFPNYSLFTEFPSFLTYLI